MKQKHTPGPWKATKQGAIQFKNGFVGETYDFNPGFDAMEGEKLPHMANARLMAAAPELLELLEWALPQVEWYNEGDAKRAEIATSLIKKIRGDE